MFGIPNFGDSCWVMGQWHNQWLRAHCSWKLMQKYLRGCDLILDTKYLKVAFEWNIKTFAKDTSHISNPSAIDWPLRADHCVSTNVQWSRHRCYQWFLICEQSKPGFEYEASRILFEQRGHAVCVLVHEVARACSHEFLSLTFNLPWCKGWGGCKLNGLHDQTHWE